MYIGGVDPPGLAQLLYEVVSNSIDEFVAGRCKRIEVDLGPDGSFTVTDDGGGIRPTVDLESVLTTLHMTPSVEPGRPHRHMSSGPGLGLAVLGALAERLHIVSSHDSRTTNVTIARGAIVARSGEKLIERGTRVTFVPDPQIFPPLRVPHHSVVDLFRGACAILKDLEIVVRQAPITLDGKGGLVALLRPQGELGPTFQYCGVHEQTTIDVAAEWTNLHYEEIQSFANLQPTVEHGAHVDGFRRAVKAALNDQLGQWRGLNLVISVDRDSITYAGPTRGKVANAEIAGIVERALTQPLRTYFEGPGREVRRRLLDAPRS